MVRAGSERTSTIGAALSGMLAPPVFRDPELSQNAATFHRVALLTAAIVTTMLLAVAYKQPPLLQRALITILVVDGMVLTTLLINRHGHTRAASWIYLAVSITVITVSAVSAGGIRSPGLQSWFIFVMLAGLLLGYRAGIGVAVVCVLAGLGLALAEQRGLVASRGIDYLPIARWLLHSMYIGMALLTLRTATSRVERALRHAQAELKERRAAEQRLARSLEAGKIGTFDWDLRTDRVLVDERAQQITDLHCGPDERVALSDWYERVHPDDRATVAAHLGAFRSGAADVRFQYRSLTTAHEPRFVEFAANTVLDDEGVPSSVLGMLMDVTEREHSALERERLVQSLSERVKELRLLHDAARLLQESRGIDLSLLSKLAHRMPSAWLHAHDACARIAYGDMVATSPQFAETPWRQAIAFTTSSARGNIEVFYRSEHAARDEGPFLAEERALLSSLSELLRTHGEQWETHQQRQGLEAQLRQAQRLDALGTLAGGIAHDFNNILTAIGGHAELALGERDVPDATAESIHEIMRAHARARDLVRRILLFSRREETAKREVLALPVVVDEAVNLLRASLPTHVQIHVDVAPGLPEILADSTQIHQIVMNLGTNAAYAMKGRGGTVRFALDAVSVVAEPTAMSGDLEPGPYVRLAVRDTGSGMTAEVMDRLFEPFFTTKGHEGTGLGLSVVHGIVRDHGGAISVSSELGVGTEFIVHLPARRGAVAREVR